MALNSLGKWLWGVRVSRLCTVCTAVGSVNVYSEYWRVSRPCLSESLTKFLESSCLGDACDQFCCGHLCAGSGCTADSLPVWKTRTGLSFLECSQTLYWRLYVFRRESLVVFVFLGNRLVLARSRCVATSSAKGTIAFVTASV